MKRAKFKTLDEQRKFFDAVKKKLGLGGRNLSKRLGFKSRSSLENYICARRAPPVELIRKLEKMSGLKSTKFQTIEGKVYRKKKEFIPMEFDMANKILKERFRKDFNYLVSLIKSDLTIKNILDKMRLKGHSFDTSKFSRCVGSYRINLMSKIVDEIIPTEKDIILPGFVRKGNKTLELYFNLLPLHKILQKERIRVGLEIDKTRKKIRVFPLDFGRNLILNGGSIKLLITELSGFRKGPGIEVMLDPNVFNFSILDSIYDRDAKPLVKEALRKGFKLDNYRSTPTNYKGDLSLYFGNKNIIIEITRGVSHHIAYHKIGQAFIQKMAFPKSVQILVCDNRLLNKTTLKALNKIGVKIINANFDDLWEKKVIEELEIIKND